PCVEEVVVTNVLACCTQTIRARRSLLDSPKVRRQAVLRTVGQSYDDTSILSDLLDDAMQLLLVDDVTAVIDVRQSDQQMLPKNPRNQLLVECRTSGNSFRSVVFVMVHG